MGLRDEIFGSGTTTTLRTCVALEMASAREYHQKDEFPARDYYSQRARIISIAVDKLRTLEQATPFGPIGV